MNCKQYTCSQLSEIRFRSDHLGVLTQYWCRKYHRRLFEINGRIKQCPECKEDNDEE